MFQQEAFNWLQYLINFSPQEGLSNTREALEQYWIHLFYAKVLWVLDEEPPLCAIKMKEIVMITF